MKTNWIEHMKNLLVKKPEVKGFFSKNKFPLNLVDGPYPIFISLKGRGIYVAYSIFICPDDELHAIKKHLSNILNVNKDVIGNEGVIYDGGTVHHPFSRDAIEIQKTYSLIYTFTKSFKGNLIGLVTNSSFFVETIKSAGIKEPVPWDFPLSRNPIFSVAYKENLSSGGRVSGLRSGTVYHLMKETIS